MLRVNKKRKISGRLRIGDDWNAITIIALSQSNPLKAIAEFVENSIDAQAKNVTIVRGKERGQQYIKIVDDGCGLPCTDDGTPDFKYVATHICDSLKRRLKKEGIKNIQGEFGIGLLSFWTVGTKLTMVSCGRDGKAYQMEMEKGHSGYTVAQRPRLLSIRGTQLTVAPLLPGIRTLTGEKIQRYLAAELRDRIRQTGIKIKVVDRTARAAFEVKPRRYSGQLLHDLPAIKTPFGDLYMELYLNEKSPDNHIGLFRSGTRIVHSLTELDAFREEPWACGYFQGIIDAPFLHITPGTRSGIIQDDKFALFCEALSPLKELLVKIAMEQSKAEEERMSKNILRSVQKALREAIYNLPEEEYDWFNVYGRNKKHGLGGQSVPVNARVTDMLAEEEVEKTSSQKDFFEFAGPLYSVRIAPGSAILQVKNTKSFRAIGLDKRKRQVEDNLSYEWTIAEGKGALDEKNNEIATFTAAEEPGLTKIKVVVKQGDIICEAESVITVVDSISEAKPQENTFLNKGLPYYTMESAAGKTWRSKYDKKNNIIVINSGHRDFIYAGRERVRKVKYICRLFSKELIYHNFVGVPPEELLERLVELSLYTEENLK